MMATWPGEFLSFKMAPTFHDNTDSSLYACTQAPPRSCLCEDLQALPAAWQHSMPPGQGSKLDRGIDIGPKSHQGHSNGRRGIKRYVEIDSPGRRGYWSWRSDAFSRFTLFAMLSLFVGPSLTFGGSGLVQLCLLSKVDGTNRRLWARDAS